LNDIISVHENLLSGSEVISGGHTKKQTGDMISLLSFLESVLKMCEIMLSKKYSQTRKKHFFVLIIL
jgi:hypothetical protein